jgi:hypothetical protein
LLQGNGGRKSVDGIDRRDVELVEKAAGVRRDRFEIASLSFGIKGAEGQRRFTRPRNPSEDNEGVARDVNVNIFQVMLTRPSNADSSVIVRRDAD